MACLAGVYDREAANRRDQIGGLVQHALGKATGTIQGLGELIVGATDGISDASRPVVVLDGSIDNLESLAHDLDVDPSKAAEQIIGVAYSRWRADMLSKLRGRFALVVWDEGLHEGAVAVDQLAARPIFFHASSDGRLAFASEIANLLRLLPKRPSPDDFSVVRHLTAGFFEHGRTLYEGVQRLEGGYCLRLDREGWAKQRYWAPTYRRPLQISRAEAIDEIRSRVGEAVIRRTPEDGTVGVLLSGGIDSSSLTGIASGLESVRDRLATYSSVFPDHPQVDETPRINAITSHLGLPSTFHAVGGGRLLPASLEFLERFELPAIAPNLLFTLPLLRRGADDGVSVLFTGQGGDELFGCTAYLLADRVRKGRFLSAVSLAKRLPTPGHGLRPLSARRLVRNFGVLGAMPHGLVNHFPGRGSSRPAPTWLTDECSRLYGQDRDPWLWKLNEGPRWWAHLSELVTRWRERLGAHDHMRRESTLGGVELAHPFMDDLDLIEFVLQLPPEHAFDPDFDRPLLREAVAGRLPDEVRLRQGKNAYGAFYVDSLWNRDRPDINRLLTAPDAELRRYVRPEAVKEQVLEPMERRQGLAWVSVAWRLATTELWLRSQADPSAPGRLLGKDGQDVEKMAPT